MSDEPQNAPQNAPPDDESREPTPEEWRRKSLAQIEGMLSRDTRKSMLGLLAELINVRPDTEALERAAQDDPLKYVRTIKAIAELVTPKEVHNYSVTAEASDIIAEMRRRGLADADTARKLGRSVGITIDGEVLTKEDKTQ